MVDALHRYGLAVGMAFQLVDDVLDFEGNPASSGNPFWRISRRGK